MARERDAARQPERLVMPEPFWRQDRGKWYIKFNNPQTGRWTTRLGSPIPGSKGKQEATVKQAVLEQRAAAVRLGLVTPEQHRQAENANRPIRQVLDAYLYQLTAGASTEHVAQVRRYCWRVIKGCEFGCLADIDPLRMDGFLAEAARRLAPKTRNRIRRCMHQFCRWAVLRGMMARNPVDVISTLNEQRHVVLRKRVLSVAEFWALIDATRQRGPNGPYRTLLYWIAGRAGLRWREMRRLRRRHLDLGDNPCLLLDSTITKNGCDATIAIDPDLAAALREIVDSNLSLFTDGDKPLFARGVARKTWYADLRNADIPIQTPEGKAVMSSLRPTFVTHMYEAGVHIVDAAARARHGDIKITQRVYTRARLSAQVAAAEALRRPAADADEKTG